MKAFDLTSEGVDVGDSVNGEKARSDDPVEDAAKFHVRVAFPLDEEHVDVGKRNGDGSESALGSFGESGEHLRDPFGDLLAGPVGVRIVGEVDRDDAKRVLRDGAQDGLSRNAPDLGFERVGHPLFDFLRCHPRGGHDDLYLGV